MQKPLQLTQEEKLRFMRALYSIFIRDGEPNDAEHPVLRLLNECFNLSISEYQHYVHINDADIAKEINAIQDVRVRIYFMRIIHDVYREEIQYWFKGPNTDDSKRFAYMYGYLREQIDFDS
ncbi:hypothetical protein [Methyloprofundus sp.]|uniref:hypothetical protein n=1 Tax=Methyloprofundus sp. TaxID=2020875 RepID=UPI003D1114B6